MFGDPSNDCWQRQIAIYQSLNSLGKEMGGREPTRRDPQATRRAGDWLISIEKGAEKYQMQKDMRQKLLLTYSSTTLSAHGRSGLAQG